MCFFPTNDNWNCFLNVPTIYVKLDQSNQFDVSLGAIFTGNTALLSEPLEAYTFYITSFKSIKTFSPVILYFSVLETLNLHFLICYVVQFPKSGMPFRN